VETCFEPYAKRTLEPSHQGAGSVDVPRIRLWRPRREDSRQVTFQVCAQVLEEQAHAPARLGVLVHHQPHTELESELLHWQLREAVALRHANLAEADPEARLQRRVLADVAVTAKGEKVARDLERHVRQRADRRRGVETDEGVAKERIDR